MKALKQGLLGRLYWRVFSNKRYLVAAFVLSLLFILFREQVKAFIIILLLGLAASFSTIYKRAFHAPPVLEMMTLTIVLVSALYGPLIGAIFAIIVSLTSEFIAGAVDVFTLTYIPPRMLMAVIASFFPDADFAMLGLWMVVLFNVLQQPVYFLLTDVEKRIKGLYFTVLNIPLNFFIFKFIGAPLYEILKLIA